MGYRGTAFRLRSRAIAFTLGLAAVAVMSAPVAAWNQSVVHPNDSDQIGDCQNTDASPCIRWRKTSDNLSINVDVFLRGSLSYSSENLKPEVRDAIDQYNAIAARNPHLRETTTTTGMEWEVKARNLNSPGLYGVTTVTYQSASPYRIEAALTEFNTQIVWNRTETYGCYEIIVSPYVACRADIRKVAAHEMGHGEGLGHEDHPTNAIMIQGDVPWHTVLADDEAGIKAIYGAYP